MVNNFKFITVLILCISIINCLFAQQNKGDSKLLYDKFTSLMSPEKVYLHTDKDVYFATDTIWFSGYLENTSYTSEFDESNYIYVELINNKLTRDFGSFFNYSKYESSVEVRVKIKRTGNSFAGHIVVPEMNSTGKAIIRAYTYWMMNRPAEYMFYKEVEIVNPMKDKLVTAMANKKIKNKEEYFRIGELTPEDKAKQENKLEARYDVQFLPESGNYIIGKNAVVYIKATDQNGVGAKVYGEILDESNNLILEYKTDDHGFGAVRFQCLSSQKLKATVKDSLGYASKKHIQLAEPLRDGVTIYGSNRIAGVEEYSEKDMVIFTVNTSSALISKELQLYLHNGSEIYYAKPIKNESEAVAFHYKHLHPGIHIASVVDNSGNVYAERPFFVIPTNEEHLEIIAEKDSFKKRELVKLKLKLPDNIVDSSANFSISVTDMGFTENFEKTTMSAYMLLKSELKGYIEDIEYYFNRNIPLLHRAHRLDKLMQTQGWRYYETLKLFSGENDKPYFGREYKQTLFGKVVNPFGLTNKATVSFVAPSINFSALGQIDSGYFVLRDIDFPADTRFIINSVGKNGKSTNHTPVLQEDWYAPIFDYPKRNHKIQYTQHYSEVVQSIYFSKDDGSHSMAFELEPVVIVSKIVTPKNTPSPITNYPLRKYSFRDTIAMKPYKQAYNVGAYVTSSYNGVRQYLGYAWSRIENHKNEPIEYGCLVGYKLSPGYAKGYSFVAPGRWGVVITYWNRMLIPTSQSVEAVINQSLSDVESMAYVSGSDAAAFQGGVQSLTPGDNFPFPVLMVKTKPYVRADEVPYNITSSEPLGWQKPSKFYSPKYDTVEAKKSKVKDNRITLYWNPSVQFDENGEASIQFYTSDSDSKFRVEVEGRSGYKQYHYSAMIIEMVSESDIK